MNRVAYFDLDETITAEDCTTLWIKWLVSQGIADKSLIADDARLLAQYYSGNVRIEEYISVGIKPFIGLPYADLLAEVRRFITAQLQQVIYPQAREKILWHKARGDTLVLISASAEHLVNEIGSVLNMDYAFGIPLVIDKSNLVTGKTRGILTFQAGKVTRLEDWLKEEELAGRTYQESYAYSDSMNDRYLLDFADNAYVINPKTELMALATRNQWTIYDWKL